MTTLIDDAGEVRWRVVLDQLGTGSVVEIPCRSERDFVRRTAQAAKRAEKSGLEVTIERTPVAIRIVPDTPVAVVAKRGGNRRDGKPTRQPQPRKAVAAGR